MQAPASKLSFPHRHSDGFIVVAVLWILGALSALLATYAAYVLNTAAGFALHDDRLRTEALVSAAIELTAYRQLASPSASRPSRGQFNFRLGQANIAVDFLSEAARIDLNAAPKPLLAGLFHVLGARLETAEVYADRIIAWRTPVPKGQESEAQIRRLAGPGYGPPGAKFSHTSDLALVPDLPVTVVERALPFITVFSGSAQINVLDAAPEVLAALPGMTEQRLNAVLIQRRAAPGDGQALLSLLGDARQYATAKASNALRVTVRITFNNGRSAGAEVVVLPFEAGGEPFAILSWRENLDEQSADGAQRIGSR
jgi:general secretion pathway protein K